jgi:nitrite reductase/ring-hydroxylating ferredoxin subunit
MATHDEMVDVARRALRHAKGLTTDLAAGTMEVPTSEYHDEPLWRLENERLFRSVPLAVALTAELRESGDYKAFDIAGLPVLLVRGGDGQVRAFLNVCRHRGAMLCESGTGNSRRFVCPYHAWAYNDRGRLVGVHRADQFGEFDRSGRGLVELPCEERYGLIWMVLDPDGASRLTLHEWLGDGFAAELADIGLASWTLHAQDELPGANWKAVFDGYVDGYHGDHLHADTLGRDALPNLLVADAYGPHQRLVFAQKTLLDLEGRPEADWDPELHCVPSHIIFPNVSIAGTWQQLCVAAIVLPGPAVGTSVTVQSVLSRAPVRERLEHAVARKFRGLMLKVARDEDYPTVAALQDCLPSGANSSFLLGRNEIGVQHFHEWLRRMVAEHDPRDAAAIRAGKGN